jgi:hypothetical protein
MDIQRMAASCLKGVVWREFPPQTGILSPFPGAKMGLPCEIKYFTG